MKITIDSIKKTALMMTTMFFSSPMMVSAQMPDNVNGLTAEKLRPQFTNLTPEAASLGKFGAFQVSEYSGAANISIPLYTVKSGDVSFPITLYYDATGIKVEQDATFVGLGWNLSYGGMISHVVCGEDDFRETAGYNDWNANWWKEKISLVKKSMPMDFPFHLENYIETLNKQGRISPLQDPHIYDPKTMAFTDDDEKGNKLYDRMSKGYDTPDVFQATFCGHNISFVIDKRRVASQNEPYPITILNNNPRKYKISYKTEASIAPSGSSGYPTSFEIIDDKGITYCFSGYSEVYDKNIDSYYLTKIYGPDGEKGKSRVEFKNEKIRISLVNSRTLTKRHKPTAKRIFNQMDKDVNENTFNSLYYNLAVNPPSYNVDVACGEGGWYYKVYPKKIITALDTIEFIKGKRLDIKDENAKCISGIKIKSITGNSPKNISFAYDCFSEATGSYKRLKLTSVKIDDKKYNFEYDTRKLPSVASYSKDFWGYYNGANPNAGEFVGCSPAYAISNGKVVPVEHLDGSNRLASEKLCNIGMLKRIIYPTGGYTDYEFEANRFNDKYYYPDASHKISFPPAIERHCGNSLSVYGNMTKTMQITPTQEDVELEINCQFDIYENLDVTVTDNKSGNLVWSRYYYHKGVKNFGDTISLSLTKGVTYTIEMKLHAAASSGVNTCASCQYVYYVKNTNITAPLTTKNENGGYSIGGGVRVKTIKNYDSDGTYLNGVKYEYTGGKLLSPTVHLETHYVHFNYDQDPIYFSFYYVNTEPSYSYICSLGIPATVGYDRVVKKEIDESEKVTYRKTVLDFNNYGYVSDDCNTNLMSLRMQNPFYINSLYGSQGHLNGMIKTDSVFVGSVKASTTRYDYGSMPIDTIYYQKCLPLHLPVPHAGVNYDVLFFRKCNTWSYLTKKTETLYDSKGNKTTSNITQYAYNENNYQPMRVTVYDDKKQNSRCTCLYYPFDKGMAGNSDYLVQRHILSEVVRTYVYDDIFNTNTFVGGSYYNYVLRNNIPVVSECRSITPAWTTVQEMVVTKHDNYGNIREYTKKNGTPVTIIWSYNHQLPIMEIVGCTYEEACKKATSLSSLESKASVAETTISSIHSTLMKGLPNAYVTAYTYSPWQSVSQIIKPNGEKTVYSYDSYGRLTTVLDANQSTFQPIQMYNYNYKNK